MTTTAIDAKKGSVAMRPRKSLEPYLLDEVQFYPHQIAGVRWMYKKRSCILGDDMGLGKSLQALTVFASDVKVGRGEVALIICPVSLRQNWAHEISKFTRIPFVLLGEEINPRTGRPRTLDSMGRTMQIVEFACQTGPRIMVLNYDQVRPHLNELNALKPHMAIFDEAHSLRGSGSDRTGACLELRAVRNFLLTGTPLLNNVDELWPLLHLISPGNFPTYKNFRSRFCVLGGARGTTVMGVKNQKDLHTVLDQVMLRRLKKDQLDLPPVHYIQVPVGLHPTQQELYDRVEMELLLDNADPDGEATEIDNHLVKFLRLKQICGTPAAFGFDDHSYKLDELENRVAGITDNGEKVIVFTQFRDVLDCAARRLRDRGLEVFEIHGGVVAHDRQPIVDKWSSSPKANVIVCMTQVAGVGLNMVAARHVVFIDKLWVPGLNQQAVDRAHRIGQDSTQPVTVHELIATGTVEHRVEQILRDKSRVFNDVIEGVEVARALLRALKETAKT